MNDIVRTETASSTPAFFSDLIEALTARGRAILRGGGKPPAAPADLEEIANALLSRRGEASGVALAATLLSAYREASTLEKQTFFRALVERFGPRVEATERALEAYRQSPGQTTISDLHAASEPRRQELFRRLNLAPGGTAQLVSMRVDLLSFIKQEPDLAIVDSDLMHLLASWFNRGFLSVRPIDWSTPAHILEKIIRYEAVHEIEGWDDLRNRLKPADRRCYGFFHPQLVDEPIIFVEVALTTSVAGSIDDLLDVTRTPTAPQSAQFAIFYSISNTQAGLKGVNFGNFLIKQVVEILKAEHPHLKGYVTLSPMPCFAAWLEAQQSGEEGVASKPLLDDSRWLEDAGSRKEVYPYLLQSAARYLVEAKDHLGRPLDPVSRFHLGNGAKLDRICFAADTSPKGIKQSHALMVNYRYDPGEIERNHEAFAESGTIAVNPEIVQLLSGSFPSKGEYSL